MYKPVALLLALIPAAGHAQTAWEKDGARVQTVSYICDSGIDQLSVAYMSAPDDTSFAALQIGGVVHALVQEVSGSGALFVDVDPQSGYQVHTKGAELLFLKKAPDAGAEEEILARCKEQ